jgi:hypothetical protein
MPIYTPVIWRSTAALLTRIIPAYPQQAEENSLKLQFHIKLLPVLLLIPVFLVVLTGCSGAGDSKQGDLAMASMDGMPSEVKSAPLAVLQAYQFAVANPDTMQHIPCYCGCGAMGHTSNYSCYVSDVDANGKVSFDTHALGCSICVDITQDSMRLLTEGKTVPEIKAYIDQTYSQYGTSNIP